MSFLRIADLVAAGVEKLMRLQVFRGPIDCID